MLAGSCSGGTSRGTIARAMAAATRRSPQQRRRPRTAPTGEGGEKRIHDEHADDEAHGRLRKADHPTPVDRVRERPSDERCDEQRDQLRQAEQPTMSDEWLIWNA